MGGPKQTADFFRLFTLPGIGHCGGGPGAVAIDYDSYIEAWVERGEQPNKLIAYRVFENQNHKYPAGYTYPLPAGDIEFSRPVYPYPVQVEYTGNGDPKEAKNWRAAR